MSETIQLTQEQLSQLVAQEVAKLSKPALTLAEQIAALTEKEAFTPDASLPLKLPSLEVAKAANKILFAAKAGVEYCRVCLAQTPAGSHGAWCGCGKANSRGLTKGARGLGALAALFAKK